MVVPPLIFDELFFGKGSNGLCDMSLYLRQSKKVFENFEYPYSKSWARPSRGRTSWTSTYPFLLTSQSLIKEIMLGAKKNLTDAYIYWSLLQHYDKWLINSPAIRYLLHHYSFRWYGFPLNHSSNGQWLKRLSFNEHVLRLFIVVNLGIMLTLVVHALLSLKVSHSSKQVAWYFGRSSSTIFL